MRMLILGEASVDARKRKHLDFSIDIIEMGERES